MGGFYEKQEAWRKHPMLAMKNNLKFNTALPGLALATGIFSVYLAVDYAMSMGKPKKGHH